MYSLEQLLMNSLNNGDEPELEHFQYTAIFHNRIIPDTENARFFPAKILSDEDAKLFIERKLSKNLLVRKYAGEGYVLIGKFCVINSMKYGSLEWKKANDSAESIIELGNNIKVSDLIQAPTIYPIENSNNYQVITGHRRYFALIYSKGYGSASQFKVYKSKPLLTKTKQFLENSSREDLPQHGKLLAFLNASHELDTLSRARVKLGFSKLTIRDSVTKLGISMGTYDNYNVLTRYPSVLKAYESGLKKTFISSKKLILDIETDYKLKFNKSTLGIIDKRKIDSDIANSLEGVKNLISEQPKLFKVKAIKSIDTIRKLLTCNLSEIDMGIDWDSIDWEDREVVSNTFKAVIQFLDN